MLDGNFGDGEAAGGDDKAAVYVSYPAWEKSVVHLREAGVPDQLRRELLDHLFSPTVVTQALAAYRFLRLTDDEHRPTPALHELLPAHGTPDWPRVLRSVLERPYQRILTLDLSCATREDLDEAFKTFPGSSDAVRRKSVGFFLSAAREAGIPLSPELSGPRRRIVIGDPAGRRAYYGVVRDYISNLRKPQEHGERELSPNPLPASPSVVSLPQPREPAGAAPDDEQERNRAAFVALSAAWNPTKMPEEVDAAVVTLLRYFRKTEAETSKA